MAKGDTQSANSGNGMGYFPGIYQSALGQTAQDYDSIMKQYRDLASSRGAGSTPRQELNFNPISPSFANYQQGPDFSELRDIARTGGFSEGDLSNIRARDVSPIRSIYDSAQRGLERNRSIQGGYSPNFGAASAKMARESSDLISNRSAATNANIAEMVQRGKLAGATSLAPLEAREGERLNEFNQRNTDIGNLFSQFNAQMPLQYGQFNEQGRQDDINRQFQAVEGQRGLYGTTPALANTFGNQALNAANLAQRSPSMQQPNTSMWQPGGYIPDPYSSPRYIPDPFSSNR